MTDFKEAKQTFGNVKQIKSTKPIIKPKPISRPKLDSLETDALFDDNNYDSCFIG